ncbi:hypothetical protein AAF712_012069 [Marasmius tenuissimus]|uniref:Phosphoglucomutase n=1 Tax=Marasmius tenuissimus TaxID=585030 RepID=A0ABR2ZIA6_9AGAR
MENVQDASSRGVVIGHDHRHNSEKWAQLAAAAFLQKGMKVYLHRGIVHTPLYVVLDFSVKVYLPKCRVPFSVKRLRAACGVMITGEENPFSAPSAAYEHSAISQPQPKAFERYGIQFKPVIEQQLPDPNFPTVSYPNPEEKGALDLALQTASQEHINYVLAQDPDADRFAAAERQADGTWVTFTGDQLGVVFAGHLFDAYQASGKPVSKLAMVASTVSSKMVEAMAKSEGFKFADCLTGFKYIGNKAVDLVAQGYEVPFGYEEAIGFMFGSEIRDKDGVAASVVFAQLAAILSAHGTTVKSYLDGLYVRYGFFKTSNSYFICKDPVTIDGIFQRIRKFKQGASQAMLQYPQQIAGLHVTSVIDLTTGYDSSNPPTYKPQLPLSSGHMIQFRAERDSDGSKIVLTVRTSGTEPKIKYYLEGSGKDRNVVARLLEQVVEELGDVWMEAEKNNLSKP